MTPQEFKAWFDGFTEGLEGIPSEKQWERIKARVAEIDGTSVTYHRYVDHYWQPYRPYYGPYYGGWGGCFTQNAGTNLNCTSTPGAMGLARLASSNLADMGNNAQNFNSALAMYALGKADSESLNS